MPRRTREVVSNIGDVTNQHILVSHTSGSDPYKCIGSAIELTANLECPFYNQSTIFISISERRDFVDDDNAGSLLCLKPKPQFVLHANPVSLVQLVVAAASNRLNRIHIAIEKPRYGKASVLNWSLSTDPHAFK
ncbi:MAG: hypothetical protein AAFN43_07925 [Pseudomonadota bacterium]